MKSRFTWMRFTRQGRNGLIFLILVLIIFLSSCEFFVRNGFLIGLKYFLTNTILFCLVSAIASKLNDCKRFFSKNVVLSLYALYTSVNFIFLLYFVSFGSSINLLFVLDHNTSSLSTLLYIIGWPFLLVILATFLSVYTFVFVFVRFLVNSRFKGHDKVKKLSFPVVVPVVIILAILLVWNVNYLGAVAGVTDKYLEEKSWRQEFENVVIQKDIQGLASFETNISENIFILQLESVNSLDIRPNTRVGDTLYEGVFMPNLLNFSKSGVFFPNYYANSIQSIRAHENILCGIYSNIGKPYSYRLNMLGTKCLPEILQENGYETFFFSAVDKKFDNTDAFMERIGFDHVIADELLPTELTTDELLTKSPPKDWVLDDDLVYKSMFTYLDNYYLDSNHLDNYNQGTMTEKKFFFVSLAANHYPFDAGESDVARFNPANNIYERYLNSLLLQDHNLGAFMDMYLEKYASNSYLFILGDHPFPMGRHGNVFNEKGAFEENFLTVLSFIPPTSHQEEFFSQKVVSNKYSHTDVTPTILSLLTDEYFPNSFSFQLKKSHNEFESLYEDCHVLIQPYDEVFVVVVRNNTKWRYSVTKGVMQEFDLLSDPQEQKPLTDNKLVGNKISLNEFMDTKLCTRYRTDPTTDFNVQRRLFAHRGLSSKYPENTLLSVQKAIEEGYSNVEIDVTSLKDGTIIVFHDPDFGAKTDGTGKVCDASKESIKNLKVRDPDGSVTKESVTDESLAGIPTLEQVFDTFGKKINYHLDIKDFGCLSPEFNEKLVSLIEKNSLSKNVFIESTDIMRLVRLGEMNDQIRLLYWNENPHFYKNHTLLQAVQEVGIKNLDFYFKNLNPSTTKELKDLGFTIHVYTVNDMNTIIDLIDMGVDYLITDGTSWEEFRWLSRMEWQQTERQHGEK